MAEVDVSSYKNPNPVDILGQAGKINQLESQGLTISQQKLQLLNQKYQQFNKEIVSLAEDPNLTPDAVVQRGQQMVQAGFLDKNDFNNFVKGMPTDQGQLRNYVRQAASRALDTSNAINFHYGQNNLTPTGDALVPTNTRPGMGPTQTGLPIQQNLTAGQREELVPVPNAETGATDYIPKSEAIRRTGGNVGNAGIVAPVSPGVRLPVSNMPSQEPQQRTAISGASPELEPSIKMLQADRDTATQKMQAVKPMVQALGIIGDLKTGIGTETFNKARAGLINAGVINADANDPTVIYQEVNKKLSNYIQNSGAASRSDKAQALAEASNPNVQGQVNPALVKLARDNIALDRVEAARANAFKGKPAEYSKFRSEFPQSVDEKAFSIDLLPEKERVDLIEKMKKEKDTEAGKKFWKSLSIADSQGLLNPVQ